MANVRVVTDTVAQLPADIARSFSIEIVPVATVAYRGKVYTDGVDLTLPLVDRILEEEPGRFRTSAIPPSYFLNVFDRLARATDQILVVTLSSRLSAVHNSASLAVQEFSRTRPGVKVRVVDSLNASGGEGLVALEAAKAAAAGFSLEETAAAAERARDNVLCMFVFDTTRYVYRTGRVPRMVGEAADKLSVKPVARLGKDGRVHFVTIARSRKRGIEHVMRALHAAAGERTVDVAVLHAATGADALDLKSRLLAEFRCETALISEFSPVMSYATGPGVLGAAVCPLV